MFQFQFQFQFQFLPETETETETETDSESFFVLVFRVLRVSDEIYRLTDCRKLQIKKQKENKKKTKRKQNKQSLWYFVHTRQQCLWTHQTKTMLDSTLQNAQTKQKKKNSNQNHVTIMHLFLFKLYSIHI